MIDDIVQSALETLHAEIRWCLKVVRLHFSFRLCQGLNKLFQTMFKDSPTARDFKLSKTKCSYVIKFGLAPYFQKVLVNEIQKSLYHSVSFDEALNRSLQKQQMDIHMHYWCLLTNQVKVQYLDSQFQYKASADVLLDESLKTLDSIKMHQLSMDWPNVNWSILAKMQKKREEEEISPLEDVGSCGFSQNGVKETS